MNEQNEYKGERDGGIKKLMPVFQISRMQRIVVSITESGRMEWKRC